MRTTKIAPLVMVVALVAAACGSGSTQVATSEDLTPLAGSDGAPIEVPDGGFVSALDDRTHESFPEPLIDPDRVLRGGPPPDGIPPIDSPNYSTVQDVDFLSDSEPILALEVNGDVRGFPLQIMTWHEIVNDTIGGEPVTVSFCPLCNSATAFRRTIDDQVFDFGTSGMLFNSSLVMYDRQTETLWTHFDGQAVIGGLTGVQLEKIPVQTVSWASFEESFPDAQVLNRDTGFRRSYGVNPYPGYDDVREHPFLFDGEVDGRLAAKQRVVAVRGDTVSVIVTDDLRNAGATTFDHDGTELVALLVGGTASALDGREIANGKDVGATGVFVNEIDGAELELAVDSAGTIVDSVTGSTFDIFGLGLSGTYEGQSLQRVEHLDTFWFAIAAFSPDAQIITP